MKGLLRVYKYLLFLPLSVPLLFLPLVYSGLPGLGEWLGLIVLIIVYSGIIGGLPYSILAIGLFWWMRKKSERQIRKALLFSPLFMIALFAVGISILRFIPSDNFDVLHTLPGFFGMLGSLSFFTLIVGYTYVLIVFGIVRLFRGRAFGLFPE